MAGNARTTNFVLASATVMIGNMTDLFNLNPDQHSIGLVKNFSCTSNPAYIDLTQENKGKIVFSVLTKNDVTAKFEVFEYTAQNMNYALGLSGVGVTAPAITVLTASALTGPTTTVTFNSATNTTASFPVGAWICIQDEWETDHIHVAQITAPTTDVGGLHTVTFANQGLKSGNNFSAGSSLSIVNTMDIGVPQETVFLSAKVTSVLPEDNQPITLLFPKIRIVKGFNLAFTDAAFSNMPFEFQPHQQLPGDPFYGRNFPGSVKLLLEDLPAPYDYFGPSDGVLGIDDDQLIGADGDYITFG